MIPVLILVIAMGSTATGALPVSIAFFAAAVAMVLFRVIPLRDTYAAMDGPILVMLAALIPVSDSLRRSGASDALAGWLAGVGSGLPAAGALSLILVVTMAVTPFLNNAATVLVVAPIAASFAESLGYRPEAFLMAVAIGAGCDFLTPIGQQCKHSGDGAWRIPVQRLSPPRAPAFRLGAYRRRPHADVGLAAIASRRSRTERSAGTKRGRRCFG
jgi:di/tricarboxylate transporter